MAMSGGGVVPRAASEARREADPVLARCLDVLRRRPSALITDVDGTLSAIASRPEDATVAPAIASALDTLAARLELVAVITAREEATARRMVGARKVVYVGNYGLTPDAQVDGSGLTRVRPLIEGALADLPCVTLEDKGVGFALHYRNCAEPHVVRRRLLEVAGQAAAEADARILEGKMVVELAPRSLPDKRSAFLRLMAEAGSRGVVYLGDDLSDVVVFREVAAGRAAGRWDGVAIAVVDAETDPVVREAADFEIGGVGAVERLLTALASGPGEGGGSA
jgi:trehalose 6-phosphate phosphatase